MQRSPSAERSEKPSPTALAAVVLRLVSAAAPGAVSAATPPLGAPANYTLVWADEFERDGLPSRDRWVHDTSRNRSGWYNRELQYYARERPRNARIVGGRLIIEAHREDLAQVRLRDWGGQQFSSARLTTRGKAQWNGGYFEIRARMPCARGAWPAIWLLPDTHRGNWVEGEIDIAEFVGHQPGQVHHAVHTRERNFRRGNHERSSTPLDACGAFHTYQLLWTEREIVIGVDGARALVTSSAPFNRPMSLILNVAVGGTWGGAEGIDVGAFPARMEVDYVRVWQRETGR
jgi:beta-glucanase (GH16 family)